MSWPSGPGTDETSGEAGRDPEGGWAAAGSRPALVRATGIVKRFPGVLAVDDVSFDIASGEIVALVGQNGAGKSTLIQILSGSHPHGTYEGEIIVAGVSYRVRNAAEAESAGIALVPQEINVAPDMTVAENMYLNAEPGRFGLVDDALRLSLARRALADFDLDLDPSLPMGIFDLPTQQLIVIARALSKKARLLILDEPTAALTESESQRLFARLRALADRGVGIIFVSHRLAEVLAISHRILVMRDGRLCGVHASDSVTRPEIVAEMVGDMPTRPAELPAMLGATALAVAALRVCDAADSSTLRVDGLTFTMARGEILGLFGLLGAGCIEAALAIYGAWDGPVDGTIIVHDRIAEIDSPAKAVVLGMGLIAQDRRDCLLPDHSVYDNAFLAAQGKLSRGGFLDLAAGRREATELASRLNIKTRSIDTEVRTLSGGNQQKIQVARWLAAGASVLIMIDPTRGVDVGARAEIKQVWRELAAAGHAILVASTDAEELVDICNRVLVMRRGKLAGELAGAELAEGNLLRMASDV